MRLTALLVLSLIASSIHAASNDAGVTNAPLADAPSRQQLKDLRMMIKFDHDRIDRLERIQKEAEETNSLQHLKQAGGNISLEDRIRVLEQRNATLEQRLERLEGTVMYLKFR